MAEEAQPLERAHAAVARRSWAEAYQALVHLDRSGARMEPEDLQDLALSAYLTGKHEVADDAWARAYEAFRDRGEVLAATRCAFWLGLVLVVERGAEARGGGWLARARRLLEERGPQECAEWGYLLLPEALAELDAGDPTVAYVAFCEAAAIGRNFEELDLATVALLGQGQCAIRLGETAKGMAALDEAMLAIESGVSPLAAGLVYCAGILACQQVFDVRRAQQWTAHLTTWCEEQPGLVPYRGQCLVHRSELAQLRGEWDEAVLEADRACRWLSASSDAAAGLAHYQRAELHRMREEYDAAEAAYAQATALGHDPHPGLALLWAATGRSDAAVAALRRIAERATDQPGVVDEIRSPRPRATSLAAYVDLLLATGETGLAAAACTELERIADRVGATFLTALTERARGAVLLAQGRARPALSLLGRAVTAWVELQAPYETARTRVLMGAALDALGDAGTAAVERREAARLFAEMGVATDLAHLDGDRNGGLTAREVEVVRLVAAGHTNREIAERLVISDKTVARHLHNVLTKLDLPNRAAATAYAYEQKLV